MGVKFTVYRDEWHRGKSPTGSKLLIVPDGPYVTPTGKEQKCCLGFRALAVGHTPLDIANVTYPKRLDETSIGGLTGHDWKGLVTDGHGIAAARHTPACDRIATINDNEYITDEEREERLTKEFALVGDEILFEDTRPK